MDKELITLPNRDEMFDRLLKASTDSDLMKWLYPVLLEKAGEEYFAKAVVSILVRALRDCVQRGMPPIAASFVLMRPSSFIEALISDEESAKEAKKFMEERLSAWGTSK